MLKAISQAQKTITFETFIYWAGDIGQQFADALCERAKAGVRVHVLLDWIGSRGLQDDLIEQMKVCGVQVERYRPLRWYSITRMNNRTHRKILVIDGIKGFTGGVGIADQWRGNAQDYDHWRDSHFEIEGPVVAQLQSAFMDNWNSTHPDVLHGPDYFPQIEPRGNYLAQVFRSSHEEGGSSVRLMYLYAIAHAKKNIRIGNSYFVPDSHVRRLLRQAVDRGVTVEVVAPGWRIDTKITRHVSRSVWGSLLKSGVKIFEYQPTMYHCKYTIVDDIWCSVGSTNLDNRSFRLNDECNLNIMDRAFATTMIATFEKDKEHSGEMTLSAWSQRPLYEKIFEKVAWIFKNQV